MYLLVALEWLRRSVTALCDGLSGVGDFLGGEGRVYRSAHVLRDGQPVRFAGADEAFPVGWGHAYGDEWRLADAPGGQWFLSHVSNLARSEG